MKNLVIVESPAKSKTIEKYLGAGWKVAASFGHVSDLPSDGLGLELETFRPKYVLTENGKRTISKLKPLVAQAENVWLATDPDREGEAIAWHLKNVLGLKKYKRIAFSEITKTAIETAIQSPRLLDMNVVNAQQARRFLDRIIGFLVSSALSKCAGYFLSAGRVQSPTVHLVYLREKEIETFKETKHYGVRITLNTDGVEWFASWETNTLVTEGCPYILDESKAKAVAAVSEALVLSFKDEESKRNPFPPFITTTMQQESSSRLKLSTAKTMKLAQGLYESGLITYMRTDYPNLSDNAIELLRSYLASTDLKDDIAVKINRWKAKEDAQQAHEAIRPTDFANEKPKGITGDALKLYELIRNRAIASQMKPSVHSNRIIHLKSVDVIPEIRVAALFKAKSSSMKYLGWEAIYTEIKNKTEEGEELCSLPKLQINTQQNVDSGEVLKLKTKAPARYTESTLLKRLEREGIGRPSTYASIFTTIQNRAFVKLVRRSFTLLHNGDVAVSALRSSFEFVGLDYTRNLENKLDAVATGKLEYKVLLREVLGHIQGEISNLENSGLTIEAQHKCGSCERPLIPISGKNGNFWSCTGYEGEYCKQTYQDDYGVPYIPPIDPEYFCTQCKSALIRKKSSSGWSWACSKTNNAKCSVRLQDKAGKPFTENKYNCPECESELTRRPNSGGKGFWWGCSGFRKHGCRFTAVDKRGRPSIEKSENCG